MYTTKMLSRATKICFLTFMTLLMMFRRSDVKEDLSGSTQVNSTGKICSLLTLLEVYFGTWPPFVTFNTYRCAYMYYKRQNTSPSEGSRSQGSKNLNSWVVLESVLSLPLTEQYFRSLSISTLHPMRKLSYNKISTKNHEKKRRKRMKKKKNKQECLKCPAWRVDL